MNNNNFQIKQDSTETTKTKAIIKNIGCIVLAVALAFLTVFVLNLNI